MNAEEVASVPVVFLAFNRPDTTRRVWDAIRAHQPRHLTIVLDGPRASHPSDAQRSAEVRELVARIDWECSVHRDYSETNLGCAVRVATGITKAFERYERAIILEDDCLPHPTFFRFCAELLERYADDPRVAMISGDCFLPPRTTRHSYWFARYGYMWGWATWRRAWNWYDHSMAEWKALASTHWLEELVCSTLEARYWRSKFRRTLNGELDTWDYRWLFCYWAQHALCVTPHVNLVKNIGFGPEATHTTSARPFTRVQLQAMGFPLVHPSTMRRNTEADAWMIQNVFEVTWGNEIKRHLAPLYRRVRSLPFASMLRRSP